MSKEIEAQTQRRISMAEREIAERLAGADREAEERVRQSVDTAAALLLNARKEADKIREELAAEARAGADTIRREPAADADQVDALLDEAQQAAVARLSEADAFAEQRIAETVQWCKQQIAEADEIGTQRLLDAETSGAGDHRASPGRRGHAHLPARRARARARAARPSAAAGRRKRLTADRAQGQCTPAVPSTGHDRSRRRPGRRGRDRDGSAAFVRRRAVHRRVHVDGARVPRRGSARRQQTRVPVGRRGARRHRGFRH